MATEVLKSFGTLQLELEQAKTSLKDVDEHIKKLIGRDPSENQKRTGDESRGRIRGHVNQNFANNRNKPPAAAYENDEPNAKKRNLDSSVFKRLSDRPRHFEDDMAELIGKNQLISKIIVTPKEVPSRQDVLAAQGADEKSKARNRRMFGALLGTLQKFRQEETKLKSQEEKRAQVEKKLEEQQIREREELKKERQDLFLNRKRKQAEIRMIELKMTRMKEHSEWEEKQRPLMNFIQTKSKPHVYFLPKVLNEQNKSLLEGCRQNMEKHIDRKRQDVYEELNQIEQRMKRSFNRQQGTMDEEKMDEEEVIDEVIEEPAEVQCEVASNKDEMTDVETVVQEHEDLEAIKDETTMNEQPETTELDKESTNNTAADEMPQQEEETVS
ncbi:Pinin [Carabus blaptoides fortunei]